MSSTLTIPLEIEEAVIDILAQDDKDLSSLKACSLACKAFVPVARKHIFSSVALNTNDANSHSTSSLEGLLSEAPELAGYIRHLNYNIKTEDFTSSSVQDCLQRLTKLQSLSVYHFESFSRKKLDWSNNPLRPALLHLLHLPTLTSFKMFSVDRLVASDFIPCTNLKKLSIGNHTTGIDKTDEPFSGPLPDQPVQLDEWASGIRDFTVISSVCKSLRPDGRPVFDFSSLAKLSLQIERLEDIPAVQELSKRCSTLSNVDVTYWEPEFIIPTLADLLRPSIQTLKHVRVGLHIDDVDIDPLGGIPAQLEDIRQNEKNVLETLDIFVLVQTDSDCRTGDDWGKLDEVLTKSGWPSLKKVSLTIEIASFGRQGQTLDEALRKLPETQFARLSKSESIEFKFDIENTLV
ncbi:hypothetical protein CPB84DRAFT_1959299 [Gymnopilus junonius]|uniref:Uncharacterized protein n=1 Tax=Gymnopilus junonius TaxID=109634 RepID=A0A9P5TQV0_GYMJU|nr:hypothetical protein CPB84DRAFT_1959299 [Gymnopilus junonius]